MCICLCSCSAKQELSGKQFNVYQIDYSDSADGGIHVYEYEPWAPSEDNKADPSIEKSKTIIFEGETFEVVYVKSESRSYSCEKTHYYTSNQGHTFCFDAKTNKLIRYSASPEKMNESANTATKKLSLEDKKTKAVEFAKKYINTEEYTVKISDKTDAIIFNRYLHGISLAEGISVWFSDSGELLLFDSWNANRYSADFIKNNSTVAERLLSDEAQKTLKDKISSIHSESYEIKKIEPALFVKTEEGKLGLTYDVELEIKSKSNEDNSIYVTSCLVSLLITEK